MPTTQTAKNMQPHRLHTEAYEYDGKMPPAGEYLRAPVCCSECEQFWKALILEVDEKHTSRVPAGKASLIMAKGASGSVLQIKASTKERVTKERRFLPGLGCKEGSRGIHPCQCAATQISSTATSGYKCHEYSPPKQRNVTTTRNNNNNNNTHVAPKYHAMAISTPRRQQRRGHGHVPGGRTDRIKSPVYPEPPDASPRLLRSHYYASSEAGQPHHRHAHPALEPICTRIDGDRRPEESLSHLAKPRGYSTPMFPVDSQGLHSPWYGDSVQLRPLPTPTTSLAEKAISRFQTREFLSRDAATPRMYSPMAQTPRASALQEKSIEDYLRYLYPPTTTPQTPGSRGRWETPHDEREHRVRNNNSAGVRASFGVDRASPKHPPNRQDYHLNSAASDHRYSPRSANPKPSPGSDYDVPSKGNLSRTSTIESGYTSLSVSRSDYSASSSNSQDLDLKDSPAASPRSKLGNRARGFDTKTRLRPQNLLPRHADSSNPVFATGRQQSNGVSVKIPHHGPLHNLSRTSTGTSSLMEPIILFTGHACRSETDEYSDNDDVAVTNPNYFKHIITNPNYLKHIVKPQPQPQPQPPPPPPGLKTS